VSAVSHIQGGNAAGEKKAWYYVLVLQVCLTTAAHYYGRPRTV